MSTSADAAPDKDETIAVCEKDQSKAHESIDDVDCDVVRDVAPNNTPPTEDCPSASPDEDDLVLPPKPGKDLRRKRPELGLAFDQLEEAESNRDSLERKLKAQRRALEKKRREIEELQHKLDHTEQLYRDSSVLVLTKKKEVVETEARNDCKWNVMFRELVKYQEENGDCMLLQRDTADDPGLAKLSAWVRHQRKAYRDLNNGAKLVDSRGIAITRDLLPHRIVALEKIGFAWDVRKAQWSQKIQELLEYKARHGDCGVPYKYKPNPNLGYWVSGLRRDYWLLKEGKPNGGRLTDEKIEELNGLGFIWKSDFKRTPRKPVPVTERKLTEEEDWEECYQMLVRYHAMHGHCRDFTPRNLDVLGLRPLKNRLVKFVAWQRKQYKAAQAGHSTFITGHRIEKLEGIGFEWVISKADNSHLFDGRKRRKVEASDSDAQKDQST